VEIKRPGSHERYLERLRLQNARVAEFGDDVTARIGRIRRAIAKERRRRRKTA
jgi:hypothetical protein